MEPLLWGHPFVPEIWPFNRGGLPSGVEINTFLCLNLNQPVAFLDGLASLEGLASRIISGFTVMSCFQNETIFIIDFILVYYIGTLYKWSTMSYILDMCLRFFSSFLQSGWWICHGGLSGRHAFRLESDQTSVRKIPEGTSVSMHLIRMTCKRGVNETLGWM